MDSATTDEQMKHLKINELKAELAKLGTRNEKTKMYQLGIFKGRVHELESLGVLTWEERAAFDDEAHTVCGFPASSTPAVKLVREQLTAARYASLESVDSFLVNA